jgi:hypothetical protein
MSFLKTLRATALVFTVITGSTTAAAAPADIADNFPTTVSYKRVCLTAPPTSYSANVAIPVVDVPVHMMVSGVTNGSFPGIAEATIIRNTHAAALQWVATDYYANYNSSSGYPSISVGLSSTPGTHILFADDNGNLGLEVANATEVKVDNMQNVTEGVCLTFMW